MDLQTRISELMSKEVVSVASTDSLWDVERIFKINHLRHAPVIEEGELVGMISLLDLQAHLPDDEQDISKIDGKEMKVSTIMATDPIVIQADQTLEDAAEIIIDNEFHALPVLHGDELAGIISSTDVIRYLLDMARS